MHAGMLLCVGTGVGFLPRYVDSLLVPTSKDRASVSN